MKSSGTSIGLDPRDYINSSNTSNRYQSAYRKFHSTETALPKIHNDTLASMDSGTDIAGPLCCL